MPFSDVIAKYRTLYPDIGKMEKPHLHEYLQLIVNELEKRSWGTYAGEITDNASLISRESGTHNKKGVHQTRLGRSAMARAIPATDRCAQVPLPLYERLRQVSREIDI